MTTEITTDVGLRSSPVAGPALQDSQAFWRQHAGRSFKVISCVATALATTPPMPSPDTGSANDVLVAWCAVQFLFPLPDGNVGYGVLLIMAFELQQAIQLGVDVLDFGASPFISIPAASNVLQPQNFFSYLTEASAVQGFQGQPITF